MRLALAAAIAVAALSAVPASADSVCYYRPNFGGACVYVDPSNPRQPVTVTCGGTTWTCASI